MISIWLFIAWRYLTNAHKHNSIRFIAKLSCTSIAVGTFCLALITSIMSGFEKSTHEKFQSLHADIIMQQYGADLDIYAIESVIKQEFPEIISFSPCSIQQCSIQNISCDQASSIIAIKGIIPTYERQTTNLHTTLVQPSKQRFEDVLDNNTLVIGHKLAEHLAVCVGDMVTIVYTPDLVTATHTLKLEQRTAVIGGIFKSGIEEFDENLVYCNLTLLKQLFPDADIQSIGLKRTANCNEKELIKRLQKRFGFAVCSWKELYPSLVSALILEKYAMFIIVSLVLLIACLSIISLLYMQLHIKQTDVALLQALGMPCKQIKALFFCLGSIVALTGSSVGLLAAALTGFLLKQYPFIHLPDSYFATHLPIYMEFHIFIAIFILSMVLCIGATWLALRTINSTTIASVLKYR